MSAPWWEVCSPALQAFGGCVELVGIAAVFVQWRKNDVFETKKFDLRRGRDVTPASLHPLGTAGGEEDSAAIALREMQRSNQEALTAERNYVEKVAGPKLNRIFLAGIIFTAFGILLQIVANAVGWAGARAWFSP
jgi:hypothetical protein